MQLRDWQRECFHLALKRFSRGQRHFLCLATPGAGKTLLASTLAAQLLAEKHIDLVVCFAPSVIVADDFQAALAAQTGARFDGRLGARGLSLTYQAMLTQPESFWALFKTQRVFAIFDEIHHCAGQQLSDANAWGAPLLSRIQNFATYTLALTGTPWRSDQRPITLARYGNERVDCDYSYGLDRAVNEGVCRMPLLTLIDNDDIHVIRDGKSTRYSGLKDLVESETCRYEEVLRAEALITYSLRLATRQLEKLRLKDPTAGGLVVASSVQHAQQIRHLLHREFNIHAAIATYQEQDPLQTIRTFKHGKTPWIVSVGMISEGTNVPRLRVCCHLTRVKTELYFRQVLGRILRAKGTSGEAAYFYMPAEPTMVEYADRLIEDIPNVQAVKRKTQMQPIMVSSPPDSTLIPSSSISEQPDKATINLQDQWPAGSNLGDEGSCLADRYDGCLQWSSRFRSHILRLHGLPHS